MEPGKTTAITIMYGRVIGTIAVLFSTVNVMAADLSLPQTPIPAPAYDPAWGVHMFGGASAGRTRLIELIPMPWSGDYGDNYLIAGDLSRRLGRVYDHFIFEAEVGAGYRFPVHATEGWIALYLRYDGFPWNHILFTTAAINTGLSYASKVSDVEMDAGTDRGNPNGSRLLHYLGPEITFAAPQYRNSELVIRWHHRSGVFGIFNGVWGGSNVVTVGFRQRF